MGFPQQQGFTFIELIVVIGILTLLLGIGALHFRNVGQSAAQTTNALAFQMEGRKLNDLLQNAIIQGSEIVKPLEGSSAGFLLFRDLVNQMCIIYLEAATDPKKGPFQLVRYLDDLSGSHQPKNRTILIDNVKEATFTTLSPGMVLAHLVLVNNASAELSVMVQVPLKNLGSTDNE